MTDPAVPLRVGPQDATDPHDACRVLRAGGLLRAFNDAGVLAAADVHVAARLCELAGEHDEQVALAVALAVRAPRLRHVLVDLATVRSTVAVEADEADELAALPWPEPAAWLGRLAASPLVAVGEKDDDADAARPLVGVGADDGADGARPLRLVGGALYLDRYWREERAVAADLRALTAGGPAPVDEALLHDGLERLLGADGSQRRAAETALRRRFAVVAGGPGTGKTTTVARIVALVLEQAVAAGEPPPLVALAAPTGRAAARLEEAVHAEAAALDVSDAVRAALLELRASTLHRLLGVRGGGVRHHRGNRLPHDLVVVDETSMVSLSLMARVAEAVRPGARLVLVGDPDQLASVEAGAVLGDIVGPATGAGIVVLDRVHRFGGGIARLAAAIRAGDADAVLGVLGERLDDVAWLDVDAGGAAALEAIREAACDAAGAVVAAAREGDAAGALAALGAFRVLCAHRRGPHGVAAWTERIEGWLAATIDGFDPGGPAYVGRPLLVTENDHELRLYNGDAGVVVRTAPDRASAVFERRGELLAIAPNRLGAIETAFAMTIHKSQGSQFDAAAVLLPPPSSPLLTRELLYTAATRARRRLVLAGSEASIRAAVERPVARASGLRARLWAPGDLA